MEQLLFHSNEELCAALSDLSKGNADKYVACFYEDDPAKLFGETVATFTLTSEGNWVGWIVRMDDRAYALERIYYHRDASHDLTVGALIELLKKENPSHYVKFRDKDGEFRPVRMVTAGIETYFDFGKHKPVQILVNDGVGVHYEPYQETFVGLFDYLSSNNIAK